MKLIILLLLCFFNVNNPFCSCNSKESNYNSEDNSEGSNKKSSESLEIIIEELKDQIKIKSKSKLFRKDYSR